MRLRIVITGVLLCVVGLILVLGGQAVVYGMANSLTHNAVSNLNTCTPNDPNYMQCVSQATQQATSNAQNALSIAQAGTIITYLGGFVGFMGFVLIVVGAVLNPPPKKQEKAAAAEPAARRAEGKDETEETQEDAALTTLKVRYAKGEITKAQYDKIKKDLEE